MNSVLLLEILPAIMYGILTNEIVESRLLVRKFRIRLKDKP